MPLMKMSPHPRPLFVAALLLAPLACSSSDGRENNTFEGMSESSSGTTSDESSEGSESSSDSADTSCPVGSQGCPCTSGGFCDGGLICVDELCQSSGDGDGDPTGDGDGDPTGDGDGDPNSNICDQDLFIEIAAIDADEINGWSPVMSTIGEGMVLGWDEQDVEDIVRFTVPIPCDDFWHVWVRGHDVTSMDSFLVNVDGVLDPEGVLEIDCTNAPQNSIYRWRELNYRASDAGPCESTEDPWLQAWESGFHTLTFRHRESIALSKLYITNTQTPPE